MALDTGVVGGAGFVTAATMIPVGAGVDTLTLAQNEPSATTDPVKAGLFEGTLDLALTTMLVVFFGIDAGSIATGFRGVAFFVAGSAVKGIGLE